MSQRPDLSQLTSAEKDALIYALLARMEELERRLGLNSGNRGKPPSSDGYGKKPCPPNLREQTGKQSGGQQGHPGTNLRQVDNPDTIVDHCPAACATCGAALGREQATGYRKRQVFDIPQPQPVAVTEHRAHRCRCPHCGRHTEAAFPDGVTAAAQYGANMAGLVVYLQYGQFIPEDRVVELLREVFGAEVAAATVAAMGQRKADAWSKLAGHIGEQVKQAAVKHLDETGLRIAGKLQWLHVAATLLLTFYRASSKRSAMLAGVCGIVVHDFWRPHFTMEWVTHALCNAHHLRELKALIEIEQEPWALAMFRFLRQACHTANLARQRHQPLQPALLDRLAARYDRILAHGFAFHEGQPPLATPPGKLRGQPRRRAGHNLLRRLRDHKDDALRCLANPAVPFTNNQAERDIRMMKLKQKISGCFCTETGANTFATIRTVLSTARKQGWNVLDTLTQPTEILVQHIRTT
jgi:transposase